ncbi:MAG: hypothetical protein K0Q70_717 [Rhodospirillales bacterium]|jgi:hypothetical protein|nr:hypothetical protein [Rhodospirillales bacterium]
MRSHNNALNSALARFGAGFGLYFAVAGLIGCTPTVKVEAPRDPITINLNIKLDADVRLRVEEQAKEDVKTKPIF